MHSNAGSPARRYPVGAEFVGGTASFRVWAPERRSVSLVLGGETIPMWREEDGHFSCAVEGSVPVRATATGWTKRLGSRPIPSRAGSRKGRAAHPLWLIR